MSGSRADATITYSGSDTVYAVPDDADVTVTGSGDTLQLGSGDTVVVVGVDTTLSGVSPASISLQSPGGTVDVEGGTVALGPGATRTIFSGSGTISSSNLSNVLTLATGANYTIVSPDQVKVDFDPGSTAVIDAPFPAATLTDSSSHSYDYVTPGILPPPASIRVTDPLAPTQSGIASEIEGYWQAGATGSRLFDLLTFTDGTSDVITPGSGAYGVFLVRTFFDGGAGSGFSFYQIADIANGESVLSLHGLGDSSTPFEQITYSGLDMTGTVINADIEDPYGYGASEVVRPANGAFGIFRTVTDWSGLNENGTTLATSYDIGNGTSVTHFQADGAFGIYQADVATSGWEASGKVNSVSLDIANGTSITFIPIAGGANWQETVTSGLDGSGRTLNSTTVSTRTVQSVFETLTGQLFPGISNLAIPLDLDDVGNGFPAHTTVGPSGPGGAFGMTLADFSATTGSAAHGVALARTTAAAGTSQAHVAAMPASIASTLPGHAETLIARPAT